MVPRLNIEKQTNSTPALLHATILAQMHACPLHLDPCVCIYTSSYHTLPWLKYIRTSFGLPSLIGRSIQSCDQWHPLNRATPVADIYTQQAPYQISPVFTPLQNCIVDLLYRCHKGYTI